MNNSERGKAEEVLKQILSAQGSEKIKNSSQENIISMINSMDKNEMITKLNSLGLGFVSEKVKNTSKEDLIKLLKNNPQLLNKLDNYIK